MENVKSMTVVYADNIGLVMQGSVSEVRANDSGEITITPKQGNTWIAKEINVNDLRSITSDYTLFVNVKRTEFLTSTYGVKAHDDISCCDGKIYFTDMFSGEDKKISLSDLKCISTDI